MFGFLRGNRRNRRYRQVYAVCCQEQRRQFGMTSLLFLSYESIFLNLLALDAGLGSAPSSDSPTCCRLRTAGGDPSLHPDVIEFGNCFAMLLAAIKLEDDVRDERSLLARVALRILRRRIAAARAYFTECDLDFSARVEGFVADHLRLERDQRVPSLDVYVQPTAKAFEYLFLLFARRLQFDSTKTNSMGRIGFGLGAAILTFDCAVDWKRDLLRGRFNPLQTEEDRQAAFRVSADWLSSVGWECSQTFGPSAVSATLVRDVYDRVVSLSRRVGTSADERPAELRPRSLRPYFPRGDCDCCCDPSCLDPSCCDAGCCEACPGDAATADKTCDAASFVCIPCDCCECCFFCEDDRRCWNRRSKEKKKESAAPPQEATSVVGMVGETVGPLNPIGSIVIGDQKYPAQSEGDWIEGDTPVLVIAEQPFGLTVRKASQ